MTWGSSTVLWGDPEVAWNGTATPVDVVVELAFGLPVSSPPVLDMADWDDASSTWSDSKVGWAGGAVWTDITADTLGFRIRRGGSRRFERVEAASASIGLKNRPRDYDPLNSASPHYADLVPYVPLRITVNRGTVTYRVFTGYVIDWPSTLGPNPRQTIEVSDAFIHLARWKLPAGQQAPLAAASTGQRIRDVLDEYGWPAALRDIDDGNVSVAEVFPGDASALELMRTAATEAEGGLLFVDTQGRVAFRQRHSRAPSNSEVQATLQSGTSTPPLEHTADTNERHFANIVKVEWDGGEVEVTDHDSVTKYGRRDVTITTALDSKPKAKDRADYVLDRNGIPKVIVASTTFVPNVSAWLWDVAFGTGVNDRVSVVVDPFDGPSATQESIIEGVEMDVKPPNQWTVRWGLSDAETRDWWVLGDDTYSVLGNTTRLGF